jgi:hypothetical protein
MRKNIVFVLLLFTIAGSAQQKIDTDRPDQTESATLVPKGWFQAEIGLQREEQANQITWLHPSALWKYGINNWLELRLITELVSLHDNDGGDEFKESGLLPVQLGAKIRMWEEKGIIPQTSLIFHHTISQLSSEKFENQEWAPNFRFVMSNKITKTISLGYNLGAEWDGMNTSPRWLYTFAPAIEVGRNWKFYLESYGFAGKSHDPEHSLAGGIIYYVSNDVQLDFSPSFGLTEAATDRYFTVGLSFRFR